MLILQSLGHDPIFIRFLLAFIVLCIMVFAKRFLSKWVITALSHIHFFKVSLDYDAFKTLEKPINYLVLTTGFFITLVVSPLVAYPGMPAQILLLGQLELTLSFLSLTWISTVYFSILSVLITWIIYKLEHLYEQFFTELNKKLSLIDNTVFIRYLSRIINFITLVIGLSITLTILIPDLSKLLTGFGIGGAALALIAKDSLASIISGMFLLLDKPFVIGDWINVDSVEGIVEDISFRSTRIRTFSQGLVIIPNHTIHNANITNWSRMEKRRVHFELGIAYGTSIEQLKQCTELIRDLLGTYESIEKETYLVHFTNFGTYSLNIQITYYTFHTTLPEYLALQEQVNLDILAICEKNQIDIAFPTQTLLVPELSALASHSC